MWMECYLGDMLCAGGGCKLAIITRCGIACGKIERLLRILTSKHVSLRTRGKVFNACVLSVLLHMLHGSEAWAPNAPDLQRLCRNDRSTGSAGSEMTTKYPRTHCAMLGVQEVTAALSTRRLRWFCCTLLLMHKLYHKYDHS